ncbi:MAG: peptidase M3, partial [Treponema sp.]|nr:peptidase M3 [Treponema sp.]
MEKADKIPVWNLDGIFSQSNPSEYKSYMASCKEAIDNLGSMLDSADIFTRRNNENFDFAAWLASFLKGYEQCLIMCGSLSNYAYISYSTDTSSPEKLNRINETTDLSNSLLVHERRFALQLASHQKYLDDFYTRYGEYKGHAFLLKELIDTTAHQMSAAEEKLASEMQKTGGEAWSRLQEQITSSLQDEKGRTFNELRGLACSADKDERKEAYEKELSLLKANRVALAACLNNLKGETVMLNSRRNWKYALDRALKSSRLNRESLDALIGAIEDSLPVWRRYFKAKALILRKAGKTASSTAATPGNEGLAFYDLFAPLPAPGTSQKDGTSIFDKEWTFDEAKDYIIEKYSSFSESMGNFAKKAFESGWIDAKVRPGKVGGAYDEDFA